MEELKLKTSKKRPKDNKKLKTQKNLSENFHSFPKKYKQGKKKKSCFILKNGFLNNIKYCSTCKWYRPNGMVHCSRCEKCIPKFDHHCIWLNNCVEKNNYSIFLFFVCLVVLNTFFGIFSCFFALISENLNLTFFVVFIVELIIIFLIFFFTIWLLFFHFYISFRKMTTYQFLKFKLNMNKIKNIRQSLNQIKIK